MALTISSTHLILAPATPPPQSLRRRSLHKSLLFSSSVPKPLNPAPTKSWSSVALPPPMAFSLQAIQGPVLDLMTTYPSTWQSSVACNLIIFLAGSPILVPGLSASGFAAAFLLGTLTWRAFGSTGYLIVAVYFVLGTVATKLKITQKEALGVAEKGRGRRGPGSVIGSSAAGCVCAILSIYGIGGARYAGLWQLGFVACFCTKLSDTVSSEIGKAYGKTTYLVTTLRVVPKGTEGAVSVEGTIAGLISAVFLASVGYIMAEVNGREAVICVVASQIANFGESLIGASLQGKQGFRWLNNDAVNVINVSIGSITAIIMQKMMLKSWW